MYIMSPRIIYILLYTYTRTYTYIIYMYIIIHYLYPYLWYILSWYLIREKQTDIEPNFGEKRSNLLLWPRKFAAAAVTSPLPLRSRPIRS